MVETLKTFKIFCLKLWIVLKYFVLNVIEPVIFTDLPVQANWNDMHIPNFMFKVVDCFKIFCFKCY